MNPFPPLTDAMPMMFDPWDTTISRHDLWLSVRRLWRRFALIVFVTTAGVVGIALAHPPAFVAEVTVAALPNPKLQIGNGSIGALLGSTPTTGISPTPYLVAKLFALRSVIVPLGDSVRGSNGSTAFSILADDDHPTLTAREQEVLLRRAVEVSVDKQTGLITLRVRSTDSTLSRALNAAILERGSALYRQVVQAQANGQQEALRARVDSTRRVSQRAEAQLAQFLTSNRLFSGYASAQLHQQRLERAEATAQMAYAQAIADRDGAISRELEVPPPLIVVDPVSRTLSAEPRYILIWALLGGIGGSLIAVLVLFISTVQSARRRQSGPSISEGGPIL